MYKWHTSVKLKPLLQGKSNPCLKAWISGWLGGSEPTTTLNSICAAIASWTFWSRSHNLATCNAQFRRDHTYILGPHSDFLEVLKSLPGGCKSFLANAYSSHISSFKALQEHLNIVKPTRNKMESIWQALSSPLLSLATVIIDFLHGRGAPCPQCLSMVSIHFPTIINLSCIGEDGFRVKHFCWVATGTYEQELGAPPIKVQFVEENNPGYSAHHFGLVMASKGKVSYTMCFQTVWIPISYILKLVEASYPDPSSEPRNFLEAVHHWLLCEVLNTVGSHTIA